MVDGSPTWPEFVASLNAQKADIINSVNDVREQLTAYDASMREWVLALRDASQADRDDIRESLNEETKRLDGRINLLTGIGVTTLTIGVAALVGLVIDVLKLKLFP